MAFHHLIFMLIHKRVKGCKISSNDNDKDGHQKKKDNDKNERVNDGKLSFALVRKSRTGFFGGRHLVGPLYDQSK